MVVPLINTSLALVAMPASARLHHLALEANVNVTVLAHLLHQLDEPALPYFTIYLLLHRLTH